MIQDSNIIFTHLSHKMTHLPTPTGTDAIVLPGKINYASKTNSLCNNLKNASRSWKTGNPALSHLHLITKIMHEKQREKTDARPGRLRNKLLSSDHFLSKPCQIKNPLQNPWHCTHNFEALRRKRGKIQFDERFPLQIHHPKSRRHWERAAYTIFCAVCVCLLPEPRRDGTGRDRDGVDPSGCHHRSEALKYSLLYPPEPGELDTRRVRRIFIL